MNIFVKRSRALAPAVPGLSRRGAAGAPAIAGFPAPHYGIRRARPPPVWRRQEWNRPVEGLTAMPRRRASLGFLGMFGRSHELRELDRAFRTIDVHPNLVPEAVKLTIFNLLQDEASGADELAGLTRPAAELLGYCIVGAQVFTAANGPDLGMAVERRIEAALDAGDSLDANLVLLALHARIIQPSIVERYGLESTAV